MKPAHELAGVEHPHAERPDHHQRRQDLPGGERVERARLDDLVEGAQAVGQGHHPPLVGHDRGRRVIGVDLDGIRVGRPRQRLDALQLTQEQRAKILALASDFPRV